jgi:hypothetical protein
VARVLVGTAGGLLVLLGGAAPLEGDVTSEDEGASWRELASGLPPIRAVAVDA